MRLIDADELKEKVWRVPLDTREKIADLVDGMSTVSADLTVDLLKLVLDKDRTAEVRLKKDDPMIGEGYDGRCMACGKKVSHDANFCPRCGCLLLWRAA